MELTVVRSWAEHLVVSDHAIVRVERRNEEERRQASTILFVMGAVLGPILAALADRFGLPGGPARLYLRPSALPALEEMRDVVTCWAADAPEELLSHPRWPAVESHRAVTFYPRALVESVEFTTVGSMLLRLRREAAPEVPVPLAWWGRRRVRRHLERAGYAVAGGGIRG